MLSNTAHTCIYMHMCYTHAPVQPGVVESVLVGCGEAHGSLHQSSVTAPVGRRGVGRVHLRWEHAAASAQVDRGDGLRLSQWRLARMRRVETAGGHQRSVVVGVRVSPCERVPVGDGCDGRTGGRSRRHESL